MNCTHIERYIDKHIIKINDIIKLYVNNEYFNIYVDFVVFIIKIILHGLMRGERFSISFVKGLMDSR